MAFLNDLRNAQVIEEEVYNYINETPSIITQLIKSETSVSNGNFSDWDINYHFSVEVKNDKYISDNFAFEYYNPKQNKPSGIFVTKADYIIYVTKDMFIFFDAVKLKEDVISHQKLNGSKFRNVLKAGDGNASLYLYNKQYVIDNFSSVVYTTERSHIPAKGRPTKETNAFCEM